MRHRKPAGVVSQFLQQHYGIGWKDVSAHFRATLLRETEHVTCNLCGRDDAVPVAERDKYRLPMTTVMCRCCGLLYLNPRPTAATYRQFYEEGGQESSIYHRHVDFTNIEDLLRAYYGPDFTMDTRALAAMRDFMAQRQIGPDCQPLTSGQEEQASNEEVSKAAKLDYYGKHLYEQLKDFVPRGGKVFEPGASRGKVLFPWKALHDCEATGVEPKIAAVRQAKERFGLDLIQGFADDPRIPENTYDLVLNTRTINHMLDPLGDLRNSWRWLKPDGVLFVDIQDTIREARYEGFEFNVVEIDHPYMFSQATLGAMVQKAGFTIVKNEIKDLQSAREWDDRSPQEKQIRIVARKSEKPVPIDWPNPLDELASLMRAQLEFDRNNMDEFQKLRQRYRQRKKRHAKASSPPSSGLGARLIGRWRSWRS